MTSEILRNEECNPNLLKKKGLELLDAGKTNEAVECFSKGLVYAPFDSLMRFWRGRKLIGREEYTQSASDLKLAALENPEDWECWYYLGVACYLGGMYEEAKVANRESLRQLRRRLVREQRAVSIRKFFRNKLSVVGMVLVLLMLICAVFAPLITGLLGVDPYTATMQERFQAPSAAHLFGTDNLGRDIFARVLYGAQISMTVGFTVGLLSALIGTALGLYASVNKVLDNVLMRLCDGLKAIPNILLAITLMAVLGANMKNVIISLTIVSIPGVARIARSQALLAREQTYAEAMTAVGASRTRILWRHILPNILSPIIVQMTFTFATAIISEASLSFLGAGIPSPYPSWGGMLNEARGYVYMGWWMIVFPAIFTALSVLGFNLFGDGLRDLIDPLSGR